MDIPQNISAVRSLKATDSIMRITIMITNETTARIIFFTVQISFSLCYYEVFSLSEIRISNELLCIHRFNLQFMRCNLQLCKIGYFELSEMIGLVVATQSCGIVTIK